ncbi:MAG: response regulator transcription factor, partial [Gammaproteobacteria bacterium]|nr:response regulator transcription factor [Gammaproteobacteria bacterium]
MKILMIDDHALFRDGLLLVLEDLTTEIETFEAGSYESAKSIMDEHNNLDLILLDLGLPGISHFDALLSIRQQTPDTPIVVLSGTEDQRMVEQALQQGARGYIPKSS